MPRELTDRVPTIEEELADAEAAGSADADASAAAAAGDTQALGTDDKGAGNGVAEGADAGADGGSENADPAAAAEGGDDGKGQSAFVPVGRFNEVNERRKSVETENAQLREMLGNLTVAQARGTSAGTTSATDTGAAAQTKRDFDKEMEALQERYEGGELDDADFKREERKLIREQTRAEVMEEISPVLTDVQAERDRLRTERLQDELNQESAKAIEKYPFLDSKAETANRDAITAVLAERDALIRAGIGAGKALRMAVAEVAPKFGEAAAAVAAGAAAGAEDGKTPDQVAAQRRAKAQAAAAKIEDAQPPPLAGVGNGPRSVSQTPLSASVKDHEKWEKIPEAERAKALGA